MSPTPLADPDEHDVPAGPVHLPVWTAGQDVDVDAIIERWAEGTNSGSEEIAETVSRAAATIEGLRRELQEASTWVERVNNVAAKEAEIGRVIMQAQEFAKRAARQAEQRSRQFLAEAEEEAAKIVNAARAHALAIIQEAQRAPSLPPDEASRLQEALQLFSRTNTELMRELRLLSEALVPRGEAVSTGHSVPSGRAALTEPRPDRALEEVSYWGRGAP